MVVISAATALDLYKPTLIGLIGLCCLVLIGALFPDVDTDSKGQGLMYSILAIIDIVLIVKGLYRWAAIVGFCALLPALGHHRGWTHTWWAMFLVPLPILILPVVLLHFQWFQTVPFYFVTVLGYFSHLVLDKIF